jgi:hypothetical protein
MAAPTRSMSWELVDVVGREVLHDHDVAATEVMPQLPADPRDEPHAVRRGREADAREGWE